MRFLIVDDSVAVQAIVRRAVQSTGWPELEFEFAKDAVQALAITASWQPDMVISDWHMPGMTGLDMLRALNARGGEIPRLGFVTTDATPENTREARRLGALFVLPKPFEDSQLANLIEQSCPPPGNTAAGQGSAAASAVRVALADDPTVVSTVGSACQQVLQISELPAAERDALQIPSLVSLYVFAGTREIRGLCLLDYPGMMLVSGALTGRPLSDLRQAITQRAIPDMIAEQCAPLLAQALPALFLASDRRSLQLNKTQVLRQSVPQLVDIMRRSPHRHDFRLRRGDLPAGRLTLISK